MKKLLIGLLLVGSFSSFATDCNITKETDFESKGSCFWIEFTGNCSKKDILSTRLILNIEGKQITSPSFKIRIIDGGVTSRKLKRFNSDGDFYKQALLNDAASLGCTNVDTASLESGYFGPVSTQVQIID